jgi:hypothetical protein
MNIKLQSILISTLVLTSCGGGASSGSGGGSSSSLLPTVPMVKPSPSVIPTAGPLVAPTIIPTAPPIVPASVPVVSPFFYLQQTENCITSSTGATVNDSIPNNFVMPSQADFTIFQQMNFTCARIPIGSGAAQDSMYVAEANAYHAANIRVEGVISTADINNLPSNAVFAASNEIEAGNELDVAVGYTGAQGAINAIAYTKAVAIAARAVNPNILIISAGTSGYDPIYLAETIPELKNYISCIGVHPYGVNPESFGALATSVKNTYGLPICLSEWGNTPGNLQSVSDIHNAYMSSQGSAGQFNFFNLGELANDSTEVNAL